MSYICTYVEHISSLNKFLTAAMNTSHRFIYHILASYILYNPYFLISLGANFHLDISFPHELFKGILIQTHCTLCFHLLLFISNLISF